MISMNSRLKNLKNLKKKLKNKDKSLIESQNPRISTCLSFHVAPNKRHTYIHTTKHFVSPTKCLPKETKGTHIKN